MFWYIMINKPTLMFIQPILTIMPASKLDKIQKPKNEIPPSITSHACVNTALALHVPLIDGEDGVGDGVFTVELSRPTFQRRFLMRIS